MSETMEDVTNLVDGEKQANEDVEDNHVHEEKEVRRAPSTGLEKKKVWSKLKNVLFGWKTQNIKCTGDNTGNILKKEAKKSFPKNNFPIVLKLPFLDNSNKVSMLRSNFN